MATGALVAVAAGALVAVAAGALVAVATGALVAVAAGALVAVAAGALVAVAAISAGCGASTGGIAAAARTVGTARTLVGAGVRAVPPALSADGPPTTTAIPAPISAHTTMMPPSMPILLSASRSGTGIHCRRAARAFRGNKPKRVVGLLRNCTQAQERGKERIKGLVASYTDGMPPTAAETSDLTTNVDDGFGPRPST
jgi:hypothetical protein